MLVGLDYRYAKTHVKVLFFFPQQLTDELIAAYPSCFPGLESRIHCHYMMRCCFGPVVEACILLDRVLFLFEAGREHSFPVNPRLVRVFDPLISPRCHAIVATK
ncbi:unnamed protein product [Dibothriocephalus latus]|uniref:Uncharacterized protein n=1 Tax=Dibothriocephalus latus TaxID=60516 RepID=A0A3P7MCM4_DIBLA|nr:unnamed protein product [Dibothriocephalus latus]